MASASPCEAANRSGQDQGTAHGQHGNSSSNSACKGRQRRKGSARDDISCFVARFVEACRQARLWLSEWLCQRSERLAANKFDDLAQQAARSATIRNGHSSRLFARICTAALTKSFGCV